MGLYVGHFDFTARLLWTVPSLFTAEECARILEGAKDAAWLSATVNAEAGRVVDTRIRSSTTAVLREPALADDLFRRVKPHVPERMSTELGARGRVTMEVTGIFLPLRIYRYEVGQHFGLHQDQSYAGEGGTRDAVGRERRRCVQRRFAREDRDHSVHRHQEEHEEIAPRRVVGF